MTTRCKQHPPALQTARIKELEEEIESKVSNAYGAGFEAGAKQFFGMDVCMKNLIEAGQRMLDAANFGELHESAPYDALKKAINEAVSWEGT